MGQPGFQQACGCSAPLYDQQNHLVTQHGDDPEGSSLALTDWCAYDWNHVGYNQIATNVPCQAVPLSAYTASSSFGQSPGADLPLSAVDAECQFPANDQSFQQQNLLAWPQPKSTAEPNSILFPYGDTNYEPFLGFEQSLTAGAALTTQRLREPHSSPRQKLGRCIRCWALRKPVFLFI
jgi:hypothetical protein